MTLLKRKIDSFLEEWKADPERLPLIVKGARQIGKTESIRFFAQKITKTLLRSTLCLIRSSATFLTTALKLTA